ncbi:DUF6281 family protein [Streptomyces sp. NPDC056486]|uniref:DUF6281 family protein n=1 Tax=Streptomyces sp. NPDC056486 TaxID=3345835 RepID=UPI0036C25AA5
MGVIDRGRSTRALIVVAAMASVFGCSSSGNDGDDGKGQSEAVCAKQVKYENRTYEDIAKVSITVGKKLGSVSFAPCDDTGEQDGGEESPVGSTAYAVKGLDTDVAIAVGDKADEATLFAVKSGKELPPAVKKLIDAS